jgi:hypothetical protein
MCRPITRNIPNNNILNRLKHTFQLSYTTKRYSKPTIKCAVPNQNVGAVGFDSDTIISIRDRPACQLDIIRVYGVAAVGIAAYGPRVAGIININILKKNILAMDYCHGPAFVRLHYFKSEQMGGDAPHLALHESDSFKNGVLRIPYSDCVRTPGVVASAVDERVPSLPTAVECAIPVALKVDVFSTKDPG